MKVHFTVAEFNFNYNNTAYTVEFVNYSDEKYRIDVLSHADENALKCEVVDKLETTHPTYENAYRILNEVLRELNRI